MVIGLPVQSVDVSALAGKWNTIQWEQPGSNANFKPMAGTFEVGSDGVFTRLTCFDDALTVAESACTEIRFSAPAYVPRFAAAAEGGMTFSSSDPQEPFTDRAFAYRAGNGDLMVVTVAPDGGVLIATKYRTLGMPAVGDTNSSWNVTSNAQGLTNAVLSVSENVTLSVDSATGVTTRNNTQDGLNNTHVQTLTRNAPRPGYIQRSAASNVPRSDGATTNVREFIGLALRGMGMTALVLPNTANAPANNGSFIVSVDR
jgi:hypothetical protein